MRVRVYDCSVQVFEEKLEPEPETVAPETVVLASVSPRRGRVLIFPHACPHAGRAVQDVPKLFLRGELRWEGRTQPEPQFEL